MPELDQILVIATVFFIILSLYMEWFRPPTTFFIGIVFLVVFDILSPPDALVGFANEQIAVIMLLLILGSIIKKTQVIDALFDKFFHNGKSYKGFISKLSFFVASSSAFLNNTPIVATLIPYVYDWGKRNNISPSKLLIPLSYTAILGGTATLVGTSTNLIVNGLAIDSGMDGFGIFDFTWVGLPLIVVGVAYLLIFGDKLLPDKKDILQSFTEKSREYIVETIINKNSPVVGKTIDEAGLRNLSGLYIVEIIRREKVIAPVAPDSIILEGDVLIFAGVVDTITELIKSRIGINLPDVTKFDGQEKIDVVEAVIPYNSSLVGNTVKSANFRGKYDAAIIAIHRNGEKLSGKIGNIELKPGDLLLVVAGEDFLKRTEDVAEIYVISKVKEFHEVNFFKATLIIGGTLLSIVGAAFGWFSLFLGLVVLLTIIAIMEIVTLQEIKNSLDFNILFIAAFAISLGKAIISTGTADLIATSILNIFQPLGIIGVLFGIYLVTNLLTEFITNVAAATIIFPIAFATSVTLGVPAEPFILAVAFAASASFITPIGYQTNLMVLGPGGYSFKDFTRIGLPLSILYMVTTCVILGFLYGLY